MRSQGGYPIGSEITRLLSSNGRQWLELAGSMELAAAAVVLAQCNKCPVVEVDY
jgi:hypothetical protein